MLVEKIGALSQDTVVQCSSRSVRLKPHALKSGDGWYIQLTWDDGETAQVSDFSTKEDAERWIKEESAVWLAERSAHSHRET